MRASNDTDHSTHSLVGPAESEGAELVCALGGISATRHVTQWWSTVVGPSLALDTDHLRVLGVDWLDGGAGEDGRPARTVTTHDQADHLAATLDQLALERIDTLIGASYGGMVALAFAERYPQRVERLVVISAPATAHPMSIALRSIQRRIVELGLDTGRAYDAMALARELAMTTYRSAREFGERFTPNADPGAAVDAYLRHHGDTFARRFAPHRFLALSHSVDTHIVRPERITVPATFIAAEGDVIVPHPQMSDLAARWGGPSRLIEIPSRVGHDAFLAEPHLVGPVIQSVLEPFTASLS